MRKPIVFFVLAGFAAILASMVVYSALKKKDAEVEKATIRTVQIAVAARDLALGSKLDPGAIKMTRWPRDGLPAGAATDPHAFLGDVVKTAFVANEPLVASKLFVGEKTSGILPLLIPVGMRAMAVPVDEVSDISGFVLPHSRVDVLVALTAHEGQSADNRSKIVLENIEVLAVAQTIEQKDDEPKTVKVVTLLVTPEDAERLALASHEGALRLAMRNYNDSKIVLTSGADVPEILRAYSSQRLPVAPLQTVINHPHTVVRAVRPVEVEIMRNGQTREAIDFVNGSATHGAVEGAGATAPAPPPPAAPPESDAATKTAAPDAAVAEAAFGPSGKTIDVR